MFGSLRFLLAYLVILSHLVGTEYVAHIGFYAVRGFFIISGLMMTAALNEVYGFDGLRFWTNRALRLLPPYYLVCALTLLAIAIAPGQAANYLKFWRGVPGAGDLLINLTVLPLQFPYGSFRFIPPFWSVAIEIDMYLLLFLIVSRRMSWALIALVAGLSFQLVCIYDAMGWASSILRRHRRFCPSPLAPYCIFFGGTAGGTPRRSQGDVPSPQDCQHGRGRRGVARFAHFRTGLLHRHDLLRGGRLLPLRSLGRPVWSNRRTH
jgi:peptidoglycan/LPS O-acetylase OafA/YrhL